MGTLVFKLNRKHQQTNRKSNKHTKSDDANASKDLLAGFNEWMLVCMRTRNCTTASVPVWWVDHVTKRASASKEIEKEE